MSVNERVNEERQPLVGFADNDPQRGHVQQFSNVSTGSEPRSRHVSSGSSAHATAYGSDATDKQPLVYHGHDEHDGHSLMSTGSFDEGDVGVDVYEEPQAGRRFRNVLAFWLLGLTNNFAYVIMLSGAEDILDKLAPNLSTGVVLLADILPTLLIKITAPLYIMRLSYTVKVSLAIGLSLLSFLLVAFSDSIAMSLIGIICASAGAGLGEITFLSLSSFFHKNVVSGWSSGTGAAGAVGSLCYLGLTSVTSPENTLRIMTVVPFIMAVTYFVVLTDRPSAQRLQTDPTRQYSARKKLQLIKPLIMPYMLPLFLVYLTEYMINQGLYEHIFWTDEFISKSVQYRVFQTLYQIGVFASRSSVNVFPLKRIWVPSVLQAINFVVLAFDTKYQFIPSIWIIFVIIVYEGLLGGLTYVNAFYLISKQVEPEHREYSLGVTSMADSFGISLAGGFSVALNEAFKKVGGRTH